MDFGLVHAAIFDELERQGRMGVDTVELARAVVRKAAAPLRPFPFPANPRCVNGACDG